MGWLGEQSVLHHDHTELHRLSSISVSTFRLINHNGIQQSTTANLLHTRVRHELLQSSTQLLSPILRILSKLLVPQDFQGSGRNLAREWIATVGRAVLTRLELQHDFVAREDRRHGKNSTGQRLSEDHHVRFGAVVIDRQAVSSAAQACLHFIGNQQHIVLFTEGLGLGHVSIVGDDHSSFALNRFHHERRDIGSLKAIRMRYNRATTHKTDHRPLTSFSNSISSDPRSLNGT